MDKSPVAFVLVFLLHMLLHINLASSQNSGSFSVPFDEFDPKSLHFNGVANVSSGSITLDARKSYAGVLYSEQSTSLLDPAASTGISFSTGFVFGPANSSDSEDGTLAFIIVPGLSTMSESILNKTDTNGGTASHTFAIEFNTSFVGFDNRPQYPHHGPGGWGPFGSTQIKVFINGSLVFEPSGDFSNCETNLYGPPNPWYPSSTQQSSTLCGQPNGSPEYNYQALVEYNGTTKNITVGFGDCMSVWLLTFPANLTNVFTESMNVGFLADDGADLNIHQWNFTTNATTLSGVFIATSTTNTPSGSSNNNPNSSSKKSTLSKGFVAGFSVLGAGFGVALVFGCCLFWRKPNKKRITRVHGVTTDGQNFETTPKVINIKPGSDPKNPVTERDTAPLNPMAQRDSAFGVSGTASWLKPVTGR